jgi:hypothetical protein
MQLAFRMALAIGLGVLAARVRAIERIERQSYPVGPGSLITLHVYRGFIKVSAGPAGKVDFAAEIRSNGDSDKAKRIVNGVHLDFGRDAGGAHMIATAPDEKVRWVWEGDAKTVGHYLVTAPPGARLDLATTEGGIEVDDFAGSVKARASKGTIFLRHVDGDVDCGNLFAGIVVSRCGGKARLETRAGNIQTGPLLGPAVIRTVSGDVTIQRAQAGVDAKTDAGDIDVSYPPDFTGASDLETSAGNLIVRLDPDAHATVRASSVWGDVKVRIPLALLEGRNDSRMVVGRLNGGGPTIVAHANGGHVFILPPHI